MIMVHVIKEITPIPDRRLDEINIQDNKSCESSLSELKYPVYRCKICGYLCARENPPEICPICKAEKDRFERFL